jgi:uncharacterized membrane protein YdjX (TVP38/TMEM64 family)
MLKKSLWRRGIRAVLPVILIVLIIIILLQTDSGKRVSQLNVEELSEYLRSFGTNSVLLGMAAVYIQVMIPFVPFVLVAGANVLVFGLFWGFIINYGMAVLGSYSAFMFARYFGHARVERGLTKYPTVRQFNKRMEEQGFFYVLLGRLIPIIPSTAISLGAGITKVRARDYILGTVIGKFPIVLLESFIGHDLIHFHEYKGRLLVLCAVFVILLLIGSLFKNKISGKTVE